ncbi:hypothetical protein PG993_008427 [Apiospora rasikravindrae]|uniref:Uncharacterized protein n=1 Tax=Apiospora rasikravindrae TaxID=990691 RepID=A0ABR1T0B1_9PEZI
MDADVPLAEIDARVAKERCAKALSKYLRTEEPVSLEKTCFEIIKILPGRSDAPPQESVERTAMWHVFVDAAEMIPYNHPFQAKLVRLAAALRYSPKTGQALRWVSPLRDEGLDEPAKLERARRWVNINAFYANMYHFGWYAHPDYCHEVLDLAFGSSHRADAAWHDAHVCAAAQWIIYSGQSMSQEVLNPSEFQELGDRPLRLSLAHWRYCKEGFRGAGNDIERPDETRFLAARAANLMDCLEENMLPVLGQSVGPPDTVEERFLARMRNMEYDGTKPDEIGRRF